MLYDNAVGVARVAVTALLAYPAMVLLLRITGKRTLSKMNAFDLVVTVALGSVLATILLSNDVALAEGMMAIVMLLALQYFVTWSSVRSPRFRGIIKAEPRELLRDGIFLEDPMRRERVTREEILAAVRTSGWEDPAQIRVVTLETDGSMTVVATEGRAASQR